MTSPQVSEIPSPILIYNKGSFHHESESHTKTINLDFATTFKINLNLHQGYQWVEFKDQNNYKNVISGTLLQQIKWVIVYGPEKYRFAS